MDLKDIRYFIAVAEAKSMSQAGRDLFVSQPTLSQVIKKLEHEFDTNLFVREGKTLLLTAAGEQLLQRGRALLAEHDDLVNRLRRFSSVTQETVRFGLSSFYSRHYMPDLLLYYANNKPYIKIEPIEANSIVLEQKVLDGDLDFCFVPAAPQRPELIYRTIDIEEFLLAVPKNHPANRCAVVSTGRPYIDMLRVKDYPFIIQSSVSKSSVLLRNIFQHFGFTPKVIFETNMRETMYALTSYGLGLSILPEIMSTLRLPQEAPNFYRIADIDTTRKYSVACRPEKNFTAAEEELIEVMTQLITQKKAAPLIS